jgi:hypothetical protein
VTLGRIAATYDYYDEERRLLFQAVRYDPKDFRLRVPDGNGGWSYSLNGARRVLYHLPELLASDGIVWLCEGEKDADRLVSLGLTATTAPMGAGKWKPEYSESLRGRHVIILPDNDKPGRDHAAAVRKALTGIAQSVIILELPDLRHKGDVSDWLDAGGDKAKLLELAQAAEAQAAAEGKPEEKPKAAPDREQEPRLTNFIEREVGEAGKTKMIRDGLPVVDIKQQLFTFTNGFPKRVGSRLFAHTGDKIEWLDGTDSFFAWAGAHMNETPNWMGGSDKVTKAEFVAYLSQTVESFEAVEALPHYPKIPGHYYFEPEPEDGDGDALSELIEQFLPATAADKDLMLAAFLTPFWGGPGGQRPAFLLESEDNEQQGGRGVGKTKFTQAVAFLAGGHVDARPQEDMDKLMKRLLSPAALEKRIALLDNIKSLRFSWADLEALITADTLSGYQLYVGEGRRPNTLTWFLTLNNASLSKDMAQRCVIIKVSRPPHNPLWEAETWALMNTKRLAIIGDILGVLKSYAPPLERCSRWSAWEQAVLARVGDPAGCQQLIVERQAAVDVDQEEADFMREAFFTELASRGHDPVTDSVFIPAATAAEVVNVATGDKKPVNKATAVLKLLNIKELRRSSRNGSRGFCWRGPHGDVSATATELKPKPGGYP